MRLFARSGSAPTPPFAPSSGTARRSRGLTLIEMVVVIVLLGLLSALVVPSFLPPPLEPDDAVQRVIDAARRTALRRAETITLSFGPDGRWVSDRGGESGTLADPPVSPMRLQISPLGKCLLDGTRGPEPAQSIDPVRCRLIPAR